MSEITPQQAPITHPQSLRKLLGDAIGQLSRAQVSSPALAAELLLMRAIGHDRAWIYAHPEHELDEAASQQYFSLIARRASGVPTQHLTGHQEFWGLDFEVMPEVLIPRPETEHLIEVALERLGITAGSISLNRDEKYRITDIGTGSGCIAIALAHELPAAHIVATDISAAALEVARRNAERHGVASRINFVQCNLRDEILHDSHLCDLLVSNPPYISLREAAALPREVREHEPAAALFGGEAGTELYGPLLAQASKLVKPGGILVLELGHDSAEYVLGILGPPAWTTIAITNDLAGIRRVASAQRSPD
jgi:release factor glutamine methyltransferase